jgi:hypothetical protein
VACGTQKAEIVDHRGVVVATLLEQRRRRHRSFIVHHAALTAVLLIVALWAAPGAASASVLADAPVTTATVLAAKAVPGVQLVQTDYSATVSVPEPVINQKAVDALFARLLKQAESGAIDPSQETVNELVVAEFARSPFTYFAKSKRTYTDTGSITGVPTWSRPSPRRWRRSSPSAPSAT